MRKILVLVLISISFIYGNISAESVEECMLERNKKIEKGISQVQAGKEYSQCLSVTNKENSERVAGNITNNNTTSQSGSKVLDDFAKKHCQDMEGHVKFDPVCAKYCKNHSGESFCDGMEKDGYNAFIDMANRIINWAVGILAMIAAAMGFYAGFLYIAAVEDSQQKEKAKGILKNVVIGIFFVLAAWAIVNLVLDSFAKKSPNSGGKWGLQDTRGN